ncbi:MAG TPA: glycosyltransferase family 2 protein [Anaeromyxobacter sp.]|nr:glycosyltransferase family 2 protein [Anaeromyxobacter sp.]
MPSLSAVIVTLNEEKDIARTVQALSFADEVLVVDSGSTDRTVELCQSLGARVLFHAFQGYGAQKRWSVEQAAHDWVLALDADEVVSPELGRAIRALLDAGEPPCAAYRICFPTVFMGSPLRHGPMSQRWKIRLFDRRRAAWSPARVHELVQADGPVGEVEGIALHYTTRDLSDGLQKLDHYSTLAGAELFRRGRRRGLLLLLLTFPAQFLRHYLLQRNFRNGVPGMAWSTLSALGSVMKHLKAWELETAARGAPAAGTPAPGRERST